MGAICNLSLICLSDAAWIRTLLCWGLGFLLPGNAVYLETSFAAICGCCHFSFTVALSGRYISGVPNFLLLPLAIDFNEWLAGLQCAYVRSIWYATIHTWFLKNKTHPPPKKKMRENKKKREKIQIQLPWVTQRQPCILAYSTVLVVLESVVGGLFELLALRPFGQHGDNLSFNNHKVRGFDCLSPTFECWKLIIEVNLKTHVLFSALRRPAWP